MSLEQISMRGDASQSKPDRNTCPRKTLLEWDLNATGFAVDPLKLELRVEAESPICRTHAGA